MPNWCSTDYRFYSDSKEGKAHVKEFYEKLDKAIAPNKHRVLRSDFGDEWLGNIIFSICPQFLKFTEHGGVICRYKDTSPSFRGYIIDMQFDASEGVLSVQTETAWEPMSELWDMILDVCGYDDIDYVYQAEEQGCGLYINTDMEGRFFSDAYHVEVYVSDDFYCYESVYLSSDEELLEFENKLIADLREEYKKHPEKYNLPEGYTTRGLRKQRTLKAAYSVIENNLFSCGDDIPYINIYEYTA